MAEDKQPTEEEIIAFYEKQLTVLRVRHEYAKLRSEIARYEMDHIKAVIEKDMLENPQKYNQNFKESNDESVRETGADK